MSDGENYENNHVPTDSNELVLDAPINNFCDVMDVPPSSSRQPPDGDEFPDYHESTPAESKKETAVKAKPNLSHRLWNTSTSYNLFRDQQSSFSVRDKIAIFSNSSSTSFNNLKKATKSTDDIPTSIENEYLDKNQKLRNPLNKIKRSLSTSCKNYTDLWSSDKPSTANTLKYNTVAGDKAKSSLDLSIQSSHARCLSEEKFHYPTNTYTPPPRLHTRSQSLMDITSDQSNDRWKLLAEQRQRSLSKLKGLIIPEQVKEVDVPTVDLPEIKNNNLPSIVNDAKTAPVPPESPNYSCQRNSHVPFLSSPPWTSNVPKYSPAFKRKSLQIHSETFSNGMPSLPRTLSAPYESTTLPSKFSKQPSQIDLYNTNTKLVGNYTSDPPKSLESITSPTRSDYSFEYVSCSPDIKETKTQPKPSDRFSAVSLEKSEPKKLDDDSDNDSAVSSSQSSYMSRASPPASPSQLHNYNLPSSNRSEFLHHKDEEADSENNSEGDNQSHRLLKAQSVEAINRKNILASAKCRSGRDLKIGSPLIQRRFEEDENTQILQHDSANANSNVHEPTLSEDNFKSTMLSTGISDQSNNTVTSLAITPEKEKEPGFKISIGEKNLVINKSSVTSNHMDRGADRKLPHTNSLSRNRPTSVNDLRKSFEKLAPLPNLDTSNNYVTKIQNNRLTCTPNKKIDQPPNEKLDRKEVTVNGNATKLDQPLLSSNTIILRPEILGGSVGITLAGGADYETKEITVHKIRDDSSAHRDGRLQKGDVVLSINGKSVEGLTHRQLVKLLKEPLPEVTLVISKTKNLENCTTPTSPRTPSISKSLQLPLKQETENSPEKQKPFIITLMKDMSGLGVSLEGGKDSTLGDMPLLIKKVFKGGAAEKTGKLYVGDEILFINETDVSVMSRFEAWSILKKLPENVTISLTVRRSNMP